MFLLTQWFTIAIILLSSWIVNAKFIALPLQFYNASICQADIVETENFKSTVQSLTF